MNKYRKKLLISMQLCSIVLMSLVTASARAQTTATATANDDPSGTTSAPHLSCSSPSFAPPGLRLMPANRTRTNIDQRIIKEFDKAWRASGDGANGREGVVLIFRMEDGSSTARSQGFTNEYKKFTFKWRPNAVAIVHTHPNSSDPRPSEQDKQVADKYGVPNFTITISGMYVYDPATKTTSKVLNGLDWLNLSTYQPIQMNSRDGSERRQLFHQVPESGLEQNPAAFAANQCQ